VRAVVHKLDGRSHRLKAQGAEVVVADLYDYEQMLAALTGTQRAFFCPPVQPFMIQAAASGSRARPIPPYTRVSSGSWSVCSRGCPAWSTR